MNRSGREQTMNRITLVTQAHCELCEHARRVLERVGMDHPLKIEEVQLASEQGRELAAEIGMLFAPGIILDGKPFAYGRLSEGQLRRALEQRG